MRALVINGIPARPGNGQAAAGFESWLSGFGTRLGKRGCDVDSVALRDLSVKPCTGCWSCWWATPGMCAFRDDMESLYPRMLAADVLVWAHPLSLGATPAMVKMVQDRIIPLLHPYIQLVKGESHHKRRYSWRPTLSLVLDKSYDDEDVALERKLYERLAINMRGTFGPLITTADDPKEAADETLGY